MRSQAESLTAQMSQRYLVLQGPVRDLRGSVAAFQVLAAEAFSNTVAPATLVPAAESDAQNANKSFSGLEHLLTTTGDTDLAPHLAVRMAAFVAAQNTLGAFLAGGAQTPQIAPTSQSGGSGRGEPRCNARLLAELDRRSSHRNGRPGACGRQPRPRRALVVHRRGRGHRRHLRRVHHQTRGARRACSKPIATPSNLTSHREPLSSPACSRLWRCRGRSRPSSTLWPRH